MYSMWQRSRQTLHKHIRLCSVVNRNVEILLMKAVTENITAELLSTLPMHYDSDRHYCATAAKNTLQMLYFLLVNLI